MTKFFKKYHKWLGIILTIFILTFAVSGIILNHRNLFSKVDISRNILPSKYHYKNWNNSAVKGTERIGKDSILIYGNIGIWLTDSSFKNFTDFNAGLANGIDNKKIYKIFRTRKGDLFAGSFSGLYIYKDKKWKNVKLPINEKIIVDLDEKDDTLLVLSRSELLQSTDYKNFTISIIPPPENYDNKTGLFKTLWILHSGKIFGIVGRVVVDTIGIIFIFLCITGLIYFFNPYIIKSKKRKGKAIKQIVKSSKWNLKWHNKLGWITLIFLIITTLTGMFLRPPLLIPIANTKVSKIPYTVLDSPNSWYDKLRRIIYDEKNERYIIATLDGIYFADKNLNSNPKQAHHQPPTSVMGTNVFEQQSDSTLLVGSFTGLFLWNTKSGEIEDFIEKRAHIQTQKQGSPIGRYIVSGYSNHFNNQELYFDYGHGAKIVGKKTNFVTMPEIIQQQPISLWNLALEVHTARIYSYFIGDFYILLIPLFGLLIIFILVSGFIVWFKKHRKK